MMTKRMTAPSSSRRSSCGTAGRLPFPEPRLYGLPDCILRWSKSSPLNSSYDSVMPCIRSAKLTPSSNCNLYNAVHRHHLQRQHQHTFLACLSCAMLRTSREAFFTMPLTRQGFVKATYTGVSLSQVCEMKCLSCLSACT